MSEDDKTLMAKYDITSEPKLIYSYKQHRYENLKDAINFAKIDAEGVQDDSNKNSPEK